MNHYANISCIPYAAASAQHIRVLLRGSSERVRAYQVTLLAAYSAHGTPILIGDLALSKAGQRDGSARKIYKLSQNCVLGWTGYAVVARAVFRDLFGAINCQFLKKKELVGLLTSYGSDDFGGLQTHFIGWIVDERPECFLWNSSYPGEVFWEEKHFDGTGAPFYSSLLRPSPDHSIGYGNIAAQEGLAILEAIGKVSQARFQETLYPEQWDPTFGLGYEILYYWNKEFWYIDSITHLGWDYDWNSREKTGQLRYPPHILRYLNQGNAPVLQQHVTRGSDVQVLVHQVHPVVDSAPFSEQQADHLPISPMASYYANYFRFWSEGKCVLHTYLAVEHPSPDGLMWIEDGPSGFWFGIRTTFLDELYEKHIIKR